MCNRFEGQEGHLRKFSRVYIFYSIYCGVTHFYARYVFSMALREALCRVTHFYEKGMRKPNNQAKRESKRSAQQAIFWGVREYVFVLPTRGN